jgi:CheY-like chemotaxis protein
VDDLLFGSKIRAAARTAGCPIAFARQREEVGAALQQHAPKLMVFDLDRDALDPIGLIREIRSTPALAHVQLVGFASHVHTERLREAREAGCDQVMARSAFVAALPALLGHASSGSSPALPGSSKPQS